MDIGLAVESMFLGIRQIRDTYRQLKKEGFEELANMYYGRAFVAASNGNEMEVKLALHGMSRSATAIDIDVSEIEESVYAVLTR